MRRVYRSVLKGDRFLLVFVVLLGFMVTGSLPAVAACPGAQGEVAVSPDATPEVWQVKPNQVPAGREVTFQVEGRNFAEGVRAESENTEKVKITSARRVSSSKLEVKVAISGQAPVGDAGFYVRNPQGHGSGYGGFGITPAQAPPPAPTAEVGPSVPATPEVAAVNPARANQGASVSVKITGKNFAKDAKVSFSNSGITVAEVKVKATEIAARIQVGRDAEAGTGSLYVTNPSGPQAESPFEVVASQAPAKPATKPAVAVTTEETTGAAARYEVFNLGEGVSILQNPNKPKGLLSVAGGKLRYEEAGKEVFSVAPSEIKEIDANSVFGINTGTFHVILNSGSTYNFAAASLSMTDGQKMLDSLKRGLH
jgi:hypothetical protein